eukprot:CAMPEP_0119418012 /NCGR_PEP_ID=MMETSP1335-20130426/17209_1 /TAXON_ID=259385 /ORGANISM="Chrysoculter rhomboideus, Strain RCC1486" /LENGTH=172 /DNA_ID=CAMNT_0007443227 /DNA_START=85 /DNA_END=600 /DNA_ORIENTATION=+
MNQNTTRLKASLEMEAQCAQHDLQQLEQVLRAAACKRRQRAHRSRRKTRHDEQQRLLERKRGKRCAAPRAQHRLCLLAPEHAGVHDGDHAQRRVCAQHGGPHKRAACPLGDGRAQRRGAPIHRLRARVPDEELGHRDAALGAGVERAHQLALLRGGEVLVHRDHERGQLGPA